MVWVLLSVVGRLVVDEAAVQSACGIASGFSDDDDLARGVGEDVIGGVAEVDGGAGASDEGGLRSTAAVHGVGVGDAKHDEVDRFGVDGVDHSGSGVARLEEDGFAGDSGLFGGGFGLGEAGLALCVFLRQVVVDGEGAVDFDDVDRQDAGLASVDAGEVQRDIESTSRFV